MNVCVAIDPNIGAVDRKKKLSIELECSTTLRLHNHSGAPLLLLLLLLVLPHKPPPLPVIILEEKRSSKDRFCAHKKWPTQEVEMQC